MLGQRLDQLLQESGHVFRVSKGGPLDPKRKMVGNLRGSKKHLRTAGESVKILTTLIFEKNRTLEVVKNGCSQILENCGISFFFWLIPFWMNSDGSRFLYLFVVTIGDDATSLSVSKKEPQRGGGLRLGVDIYLYL